MATPAAPTIRRSSSPTLRAHVLAGIARDLRRQGAPVEQLLRKHLILPQSLQDPYQPLPLARFVRFMEDAACVLGDVSLGARIGTRLQPQEMGAIEVIFLTAPTLQTALTQLAAFHPVLQGGTQTELNLTPPGPEYLYKIVDPQISPRRQDAELTLATLCTAIRVLIGSCWSPLEVHFEHERASPQAEHTLSQLFRAPVRFAQPANRVFISPQDLSRPIAQTLSGAPHLEQHLMDLMSHERGFDSCTSQVIHLIGRRLGKAEINVRSIAREMGLSARTLQRRLAQEGTTLRRLVQQHRTHVVDQLLQDDGTTLASIAHDVGYSDGTTFSRAFKSWKGRSPRDHRQSRRAG